MINITLEDNQVELGKILAGTFQISSQISNSKERYLPVVLTLGWYTEGRGDTNREKVSEQFLGSVPSHEAIPFEFQIPHYAPISYDGKLIRIIWEVTAEIRTSADQGIIGGIMAAITPKLFGNQHSVVRFRVLPRRRSNKF